MDLTDGRHLRVYHLCRELCRYFECFFVGISAGNPPNEIPGSIAFSDAAYFEERTKRGLPWHRKLRMSDAHYLRESSPDYFERSKGRIRQLAENWNIDGVVVFDATFGELAIELDMPRILDYPDCGVLAIRRRRGNRFRNASLAERAKTRIQLHRLTSRQHYLLQAFNHTVTISNADKKSLLNGSGLNEDKVQVVPNGVSTETFNADSVLVNQDRSRCIAFWGNLGFPPNTTAVKYFYDEIFQPSLAAEGISWHVVGGGMPEELRRVSEAPGVTFAGFQESLSEYIAGMAAMVNPMIEGGGLKNKVLEVATLAEKHHLRMIEYFQLPQQQQQPLELHR